jgi:hypothetical protein
VTNELWMRSKHKLILSFLCLLRPWDQKSKSICNRWIVFGV